MQICLVWPGWLPPGRLLPGCLSPGWLPAGWPPPGRVLSLWYKCSGLGGIRAQYGASLLSLQELARGKYMQECLRERVQLLWAPDVFWLAAVENAEESHGESYFVHMDVVMHGAG